MNVELSETTYLIGPNASGKSNFLDVFRFMRDLVNPQGGGLQQSVGSRGGLQKLRCLAARQNPTVAIEIELRDDLARTESPPDWRYLLEIGSEVGGKRKPVVKREEVANHGKVVLNRPNTEDDTDRERLTETYLEQVNSNREFRDIAQFFEKTLYLHLVPQLLKFPGLFTTKADGSDPFGRGFLDEISSVQKKTRDSRLRRTENILKQVIPHFQELRFVKDEISGAPHLEMRYQHWRPKAGWQREDQFSDGTLRLIGLVWTLLATDNLILLEEPELSLHRRIVEQIPKLIVDARKSRKASGGQVLIATHSPALLSDASISGNFLILNPGSHGEPTTIEEPTEDELTAMRAGMTAADILLPKTAESIGVL
ncbi:MAG: ATP-binding protein [Planctomycetaceae bacterium]|nr:ATP-binding protein [Planctomycetaceae bacterium]